MLLMRWGIPHIHALSWSLTYTLEYFFDSEVVMLSWSVQTPLFSEPMMLGAKCWVFCVAQDVQRSVTKECSNFSPSDSISVT